MVMAAALALAVQAPMPVPAPPGPPIDLDYQLDCLVFGADGSRSQFRGRFDHVNPSIASATLSSSSDAFPFPAPGSSVPVVGPGEFVVQLARGSRRYSYFFNLPAGTIFNNGTVRVAAGEGRGSSGWVATGICTVSRSRADNR